ncbi:unnamed protein product [Moneuplotes crassus]|uniref:Tr-type G domain-containing protein n=1 Tax=Euplotes crassus TaxID=5936 RepID=A0AAD1U8T8_EUPCR|nr:unnamed protein product [Moneuplotes crassus]
METHIERIDNSREDFTPKKTLNINIGILGHIDSGKTSLAKALSTIGSTAGFDKNPQSKERGITLDLGFSAFVIEIPESMQTSDKKFLQITLVDCPGHASLMKTVIGGASIIDYMILVIDATKGIQAQTSECIVLGELLMRKLCIVVNKIDLIEAESDQERDEKIAKIRKNLDTVFSKTKFTSIKIVFVSANPKSEDIDQNLDGLLNELLSDIELPDRGKKHNKDDFMFSVDHCFPIKGHGTVITGTVLRGMVENGDNIEISSLMQSKKVKSMQMFRKPVDKALKGDRVGICVAKLDPKDLERGIVCAPGKSNHFTIALAKVARIRHFKSEIPSNTKYHITIGHQTVLGSSIFFYNVPGEESKLEEIKGEEEEEKFGFYGYESESSKAEVEYVYNTIHKYSDKLPKKATKPGVPPKPDILPLQSHIYALMYFDVPIVCAPINSIFIGSRLDAEIEKKECRLAFSGQILETYNDSNEDYKNNFKITKEKRKEGIIDKVNDKRNIIGRNLFNKETPVTPFINMKIVIEETGEIGRITGAFGKSGKFKAKFDKDLENIEELKGKAIYMPFNKLLFGDTKKLMQTI